jgi:hypothetical protein
MKKTGVLSTLIAVILVAVGAVAHAQQTGKVPRRGYLDNSTAVGSAGLLEVFWQESASLDGSTERISPSSTGLPSKRLSACLSLPRTWFVSRLI